MKIVVLNGSPKGEISVTMQYVHYMRQALPEHEWDILHIAQRVKRLERDEGAFHEVIERIRAADGVLWAFPLYYMLVHGNYKRFIELIWERDVQEAFQAKHAATLSTSIHYYDHTAHNYVHAICDDLDMRYVGAFAADMQDLLKEEGQRKLALFARDFVQAIEDRAPAAKVYAPVAAREFVYVPGPAQAQVDLAEKRLLIVTDAQPHQSNLLRMIERFKAAFSQEVETINLRDLDIKGGCLGCLHCGYDNECTYQDKDEYVAFHRTRLKGADIVVFAGAIQDRYLSSTWKTFFDRSFYHTHAPSMIGKQFGFLISGPLGQNANLRQVLSAWVEMQRANLAGFVTDEFGDSAEIDGLLQSLAQRLVRFSGSSYVQPQTFLGVGGTKIFRDDVWGRLRGVFQADHRAYKRLGVYDFPQKDLRVRVMNSVLSLLFRIPGFRQEFARRTKREMIRPYQQVLKG